MGSSPSKLGTALHEAVGNDKSLVALPGKILYEARDVKRYNLAIPITPAAITYPKTAAQVSAIIKCARDAGLKVQARSGGHSYGNYGTFHPPGHGKIANSYRPRGRQWCHCH
jgi:hypothetical protein